MSYEVLARKWRPRSFQEMVGQEHVLRALINALDSERLHHGYLFTGTRGVGKTTLARIMAKCLNCETGVTSKPCGKCGACVEIDGGRFVDLIEVDAASRAKVEETRDLMDNTQYTPASGRYKVYLIDEAHMFSKHSFNALLKTLEEPPPHVKFLLATTEAKKIPPTILSRCLQFHLKHLGVEQIEGKLTAILQEEKAKFEPAAVRLIAVAAQGSMRDALSILDQALSYGDGALQEEPVAAMLGVLKQDYLFDLLNGVVANDPAAVLARIDALAETAPDYDAVLAGLLSILHHIAVAQALPTESDTVDEAIRPYRDKIATEDTQLYYQIAVNGRKDLAAAPEPRLGFEMTMIRMLAFQPLPEGRRDGGAAAAGSGGKAAASGARAPVAAATAATRAAAPTATAAKTTPTAPAPATAAQRVPAAPTGATDNAVHRAADNVAHRAADAADNGAANRAASAPANGAEDWHEIIQAMGLSGMDREFAVHCSLKARAADRIHLVLRPAQEHLLKTAQRQRLQKAVRAHFGEKTRLVLTVEDGGETPAQMQTRQADEAKQAALLSIEQDDDVQDLVRAFNATVDKNGARLYGQGQAGERRP